ncbi:hypothetical protein Zm00014a_020720 [Zea mays]|uniref:RNI-like superfamily protein n=1 Tax=Zea mays TaxID=4577 RepID=A0A3L6FE29_MAIZE|nr:hypothetical protein Zm00014a_020720 [Zea mays]
MKPGSDSIGIIAVSHNCSGVAAQADQGLVPEPQVFSWNLTLMVDLVSQSRVCQIWRLLGSRDAGLAMEAIHSLSASKSSYPMVDLTQLFMTATQEGKILESQGQILKVLPSLRPPSIHGASVHILGATALISLLQPAPEIYELFDDIVLLAKGQIVYQGPRENVTSRKDQYQHWCTRDEPYRSLIPFISWSIQKENPLLRLTIENCELSSIGVIILLECLTNAKQLLDVISIADNHLGSSVAVALARFLGSHVRALNATDNGLGTATILTTKEARTIAAATTKPLVHAKYQKGGQTHVDETSKKAIRMSNMQLCQHEQFILASPHPPLHYRRADSRSRGSDLEDGYVFVSTRLKILFKEGDCGTFDPLFLNLIASMQRYNQIDAQSAASMTPMWTLCNMCMIGCVMRELIYVN